MMLIERTNTPNVNVTIAIPAYNEADYIESVISTFLEQSYPQIEEILIADGGSTDGTQEIVKTIAEKSPKVKLLHNPQKIQSSALNLMLQKAKGDIFLRSDAHCEYATDYVEKCVEALLNSEAINVGGSQRYVAKTPFQAGVALASRSFINGGAKYRNTHYNGYADTVYLGCFWKQALLEIAQTQEVFDTTQVTNQDAELNLKLVERKEKAIYVSSDIKAWYYPRSRWNELCKQFFKYGRGRYLTATKHPKNAPLRSKVPFFFVSLVILASGFDLLLFKVNLHLIQGISALAIVPFIESVRVVRGYREQFKHEFWRGNLNDQPSSIQQIYFCFIALVTMPISYGLGHGYQLIKHKVFQCQGW